MKRHGRARVDPNNLDAFAICDRSGFLFNLSDLAYDFEWSGNTLINSRLLVAERFSDNPAEFLRSLRLKPDPAPIRNPRPASYLLDESDYRITQDGQTRITEDGANTRVTEGG